MSLLLLPPMPPSSSPGSGYAAGFRLCRHRHVGPVIRRQARQNRKSSQLRTFGRMMAVMRRQDAPNGLPLRRLIECPQSQRALQPHSDFKEKFSSDNFWLGENPLTFC